MKLNLMTPINQLGYGIAGINILKALQGQADVALHMIGQPQVTNQIDADAVTKGLEAAKTFDRDAPCIKIWHQHSMSERIGSGTFIGFPIFELDTFSDLEKHHLKSCDRLFVCSEWAKKVCYDINLADVVPLGVDASIFNPAPPRNDQKTIFFNCGKWEVRKGHDILAAAFKEHLKKFPNSELWMMCSNPFNSPKEDKQWQDLYAHPNIKIIPRVETQQEVYNIMRQTDCGVFPSHGEGWNLELLEMMACGKQVIATNYSAHTEFCNEQNCFLIPVDDVEPAFDNKWFFGQGNWGKIDTAQITEKMDMVASSARNTVNQAGIETAKQYSWENTARKIIEYV